MTRTINATRLAKLIAGDAEEMICVKIARRDGQVFGFRDGGYPDIPFTFDIDGAGEIEYSPAVTFDRHALAAAEDLSTDETKAECVISDETVFTEASLVGGIWDRAEFWLFSVDWSDDATGAIKFQKGWLGEVERRDTRFAVELRGLSQVLKTNIVSLTSGICRSDFGDQGGGASGGCKFDLSTVTETAVVTEVVNRSTFVVTGAGLDARLPNTGGSLDGGFFLHGTVAFTTGLNANLDAGEIVSQVDESGAGAYLIQVMTSFPFEIQVGDQVTLVAGCDGTHGVCKNNWNNLENRRAEDFLPGDTVFEPVTGPSVTL